MQNYIPGVRLTGDLRIAPAIMKDGRVRIAKATVQSDVDSPDRIALSACLFPSKPYNAYAPGSTDTAAAPAPTLAQVTAGGAAQAVTGGVLATDGNTSLPFVDAERYPNLAEGNAPDDRPVRLGRRRAPRGRHRAAAASSGRSAGCRRRPTRPTAA